MQIQIFIFLQFATLLESLMLFYRFAENDSTVSCVYRIVFMNVIKLVIQLMCDKFCRISCNFMYTNTNCFVRLSISFIKC